MLPKKESEGVEFKKSTIELKQGIISLVAMLNKNKRALVYFGINNEGTIVGQQIGKDTTRDISSQIKNYIRPIINPSIEIIQIESKNIIKLEVYGEDLPYSAYGRYYIRSDDEDLIMSNSQLEQLFINKNVDYSKWENEATDYTLEIIDESLLIEYINKSNEIGRVTFNYKDVEDTLMKLQLMKNGKINNAGVYLFSKLKPLTLKMAVYTTDSRISFIDNRIFKGNIFECIEESYKYIIKNIKWGAEIMGMERIETPEVPVEAIREIIVNSFAHMKVNNSSFNEIYITPKKIHIFNPGIIIQDKSPLDFASGKNGPIARNPLINTILYLNKTIESFGTGFARVFDLCDKKGIIYNYYNNEFGFNFEFLRTQQESTSDIINVPIKESLKVTAKDATRLSDIERRVYELIKIRVGIKRDEIAREIEKTPLTAQRIINNLLEMKLILRVGSRKNGYWLANE